MLLLLFHFHIDLVYVSTVEKCQFKTKTIMFTVHHFDAIFEFQNAPNSIP